MSREAIEGRSYVARRLRIRDVRIGDLLAHYGEFDEALFQVVTGLRPTGDDYMTVGTYNEPGQEWEMFALDSGVWVLRPGFDA
jgi:hypothetical protein